MKEKNNIFRRENILCCCQFVYRNMDCLLNDSEKSSPNWFGFIWR